MNFVKTISTIFIVMILVINCSHQNASVNDSNEFYVASWNVENLFDAIDDPGKEDEWFTPKSEINWTNEKLKVKIKNLSKVISYMNDGTGPDILGVQEVEHYELLEMLKDDIKLEKNYKIIHEESPDIRGIDNAILYNADIFDLMKHEALTVYLEDGKTTRQIIYAELKFKDESLHVFVNHWPSRRSGLKETEGKRIAAAETLMRKLKEIGSLDKENIIIMGDFNDLPSNVSISEILGAQSFICDTVYHDPVLLNLSYKLFQSGKGTYKFRDHWNMLDQMIISNSLYNMEQINFECESFEIIKPKFIIQKDGKYAGTSLPTYGGRKYLGGFSDHFSIGAKFVYSNQ